MGRFDQSPSGFLTTEMLFASPDGRPKDLFILYFCFTVLRVNKSTSMEIAGERTGQEGGESVLRGCHLACHRIGARPRLHAWHVSDGSRSGSGYFSARQT